LFFCASLCAQGQEQVELKKTHLFSLGMGLHASGADLADRFGSSKSANLSWELLAPSRVFYGLEGGVFFGGNVKEPNLGANLISSNGTVTGTQGIPVIVDPSFFAYKIQFNLGKTWQLADSASWMWLAKLGLGFIEHHIAFNVNEDELPQLTGEYVKGYDRLTNGIHTELYCGIMHLDENRLKNFYVGVQVLPAFTGERRAFNFDTQTAPIENRFDLLLGVRAGWVLPIYRVTKDTYYYN